MNRSSLIWLILGALTVGASVPLIRAQLLVGFLVLAVGIGFFLFARRGRTH